MPGDSIRMEVFVGRDVKSYVDVIELTAAHTQAELYDEKK